jgi:hypothetical protein
VSREIHIECGPLVEQIKGFFDFDPAAVMQAPQALLTRTDLTGQSESLAPSTPSFDRP